MTATEPKKPIQHAIEKLGLSIKAEFVPWSKSRNAKEKHKSLNWRVTLLRGGKEVLTTDYRAGEGHCPSYKQTFGGMSIDQRNALDYECENGSRYNMALSGKPILPDAADVIYSLVMDADVLNYAKFEEWAENFGYDPDSRKGEAIYRTCLEHALALRNAIGDDGLRELQEAGQDY